MAKPPDAHIPKNDRSVWKGLVVDATEFTPPKSNRRVVILGIVLVVAAAALVVVRFVL